MKKAMWILATGIVGMFSCAAFADTDGIWTYSISGGGATITSVSTSAEGNIAVPATLGGFPVTRIGDEAFLNCRYLTGVSIPDSVTDIGDAAFWGCSSMADDDGFVIVRGVLHYYIYDDYEVTIPPGVTRIGAFAFYYYYGTDVESVYISADVTSIGANAFLGASLTTVHVQAGYTDYVKGLIAGSGYDPAAITFIEDVMPPCTVTFNANGGSVSPATRLVMGGRPIGALPVPTLAGYLPLGWFTAPSGGDEITAASVMTADMTLYAHWTEAAADTWFTRRADALAEARRTGKKVFLIRGRDTCPNTMYTKNTACESPSVKPKLIAKCVLWYCNIDGEYEEESSRYRSSSSALPLVCVIDPNDENNFLKRSNGRLTGEEVLALIADIPYPATITPSTPSTPSAPSSGSSSGSTGSGASNPVMPGNGVVEAADIGMPYKVSKAVTLMGAVYNGGNPVGIVELKLGKVTAKQTSKVSGTVRTLSGKHTIKPFLITGIDGKTSKTVSLDVKGLGTMSITIGGTRFAGTLGGWHVQNANVGGKWTRSSATVYVDATSASFPAGTLSYLLPDIETATVKNGRWTFAKAASVKWAKPKNGVTPEIYDESVDKGLIVDETKGKTNLSGLKLTYTPRDGTFKGSFKMYVLEGTGARTKLKSATVNVNGFVVDGVGYGTATCKSPAAGPWAVTVE